MESSATLSIKERGAQGKALRDKCMRSVHAEWQRRSRSHDPIKLLEESAKVSLAGPAHHRHNEHEPDHSKAFSTWSYKTDQPRTLEALREKLRKLPGSVYRAKGVVYSFDSPERRAVLQVVGRRVDISIQEEWGAPERRMQIVAIGAAGSIDAGLLENTFASCIAAAAANGRA